MPADYLPAETPKEGKPASRGNLFNRAGGAMAKWFRRTSEKTIKDLDVASAYAYGDGLYSAAYTLLGTGTRAARTRYQIMSKWNFMAGDPVISTALSLLTTSALGGHQTTGDVIFIEGTPDAQKNPAMAKLVDEIKADLTPLFNRIAFTVAYLGTAFGDAYARVYALDGVGVVDLYVDEMVSPATILPFEQGNRTIGYATCVGEKQLDRLSVLQIARLKMPRRVFVPQFSVTEKVWRMTLLEDDPEKLPILPAAAGGSFLYEAENAYDNMIAALVGIVGQRVLDSIDESVLGVQLVGATKEQQEKMLKSIVAMLKASKERAENAVSENRPVLERVRHILPIFNEKQIVNFDAGSGAKSQRSGNISIEDVIFHARMLAGCLGVDLSMIGFADQMSGGLGEGGFFRTSAQAAERARVIRSSLADFFNYIIDIHTYKKYNGKVFDAKDRPWNVNFYGSISALENEKQTTRANAMNAGSLLVQTMQQFKEVGANKEQMTQFLSKQMLLDEADAKMFAGVVDQLPKQPPQEGGFGAFGGGGEGGPPFGGGEDDAAGEGKPPKRAKFPKLKRDPAEGGDKGGEAE